MTTWQNRIFSKLFTTKSYCVNNRIKQLFKKKWNSKPMMIKVRWLCNHRTKEKEQEKRWREVSGGGQVSVTDCWRRVTREEESGWRWKEQMRSVACRAGSPLVDCRKTTSPMGREGMEGALWLQMTQSYFLLEGPAPAPSISCTSVMSSSANNSHSSKQWPG